MSGGAGAATLLDQARVDVDVRVDHAVGAEALHRVTPHQAAVERQHLREPLDEIVERLEDSSGYAGVDDLADGTASERGDRGPAGHGFCHDEPEGFARLHGVEQGPRPTE